MRLLPKTRVPTLLFLITFLSLQAQPATVRADRWGDGWHDGWGWGHMFFGSFAMLLFWGGLIVLLVLAVRLMGGGSTRSGDGAGSGNRALDILEKRYARGEIDREEFEERKDQLSM